MSKLENKSDNKSGKCELTPRLLKQNSKVKCYVKKGDCFDKIVDKNRPFTDETVYIIKLWHELGDSPEKIAIILVRPLEVVEAVLRGEYDHKDRVKDGDDIG